MQSATRYTFSGHESFSCKSLWLKKGYDFVASGEDFNSANAVVALGVGKNMVASIRYWMRAFGLLDGKELTPISHYLFASNTGRDPYLESLGSIWLLHFLILRTELASLYRLCFLRFQKERRTFDRQCLLNYVKRILVEEGKTSFFNENTMKKDIGVLLQNYMVPSRVQSFEDYSSLLIDLDLIRRAENEKLYQFNVEGKRRVPEEILLYAILENKNEESTVGYSFFQELSLMFCMSESEMLEALHQLQENYPNEIRYSDTAGMRQLQFLCEMNPIDVLDKYYTNHA